MANGLMAFEAFSALTAADLAVTDVVTVGERESLAAAWELLARSHCRFLPVVRGPIVVGLIDEHAMVSARSPRWLDGRQRLVGDAALPARHVAPTAAVTEVISELSWRGAPGAVVVVDDDDRLFGIVTASDVLRAMTAHDRALAAGS